MTDAVNLLISTHLYFCLGCLPVLLMLEALKLRAPASVTGQLGYVAWFSLSRTTKWNLGWGGGGAGESKQHEAAGAQESQIFWWPWWLRTCVPPKHLWQGCRVAGIRGADGRDTSAAFLLEQPCGVVLPFPSGCFVPAYLASQPGSPTSPEVLRTTQSFFFLNKQSFFCWHLQEDYAVFKQEPWPIHLGKDLSVNVWTQKTSLTEIYENEDISKWKLHSISFAV